MLRDQSLQALLPWRQDAFRCDVVALHSFTVASVPVQFFFFDFSCFFPSNFIYRRSFLNEVAEAPIVHGALTAHVDWGQSQVTH